MPSWHLSVENGTRDSVITVTQVKSTSKSVTNDFFTLMVLLMNILCQKKKRKHWYYMLCFSPFHYHNRKLLRLKWEFTHLNVMMRNLKYAYRNVEMYVEGWEVSSQSSEGSKSESIIVKKTQSFLFVCFLFIFICLSRSLSVSVVHTPHHTT